MGSVGVEVNKTFSNLLLSVGAMKAGTTWLYAVLSRNPALHFAMEKEIHYFYHKYVNPNFLSDQRRLNEAKKRYILRFDPEKTNIDAVRQNLHWVSAYLDRPIGDFWFRNLFQLRKHHKYACDFSNLNSQLPEEVWPEIEAQCDNLRVLYTMRDPVKRLWSHAKFQLQLDGKVDKLESWGPDEFRAFVKQDHLWKNAEYGKALRAFKGGLKPGTLKALFYEDIHADQRGSLREIEEFLDLPAFNYPQNLLDRRFTESVKVEMPSFFPELFADDIARIKAEVEAEGYTLPESWS